MILASRWLRLCALCLFWIVAAAAAVAEPASSPSPEITHFDVGGFTITEEVVVPAAPEFVYDHLSGDISAWWDHTMSKNPKVLRIDPRIGGKFYEIFDDEGNGVEHARVTYAQRGVRLTFEGPLGLHGKALNFVCNYFLSPAPLPAAGATEPDAEELPGTRIRLEVQGWGDSSIEGLPEIVASVWHHFLVERFVPYITAQAGSSQ